MSELEDVVRKLTRPINGQYPRPWMTSMKDPARARVFVVGRNQATGFPENAIESHAAYLDALFNRNGRSARALYDQIRTAEGRGPSPTRKNLDSLTSALLGAGVTEVLETNVICYSTPMSRDLSRAQHDGGRQRGTEIFTALLDVIRPAVLIAHGSGTHRDLARLLGVALPAAPESAGAAGGALRVHARLARGPYDVIVYVIPSLAPPAFNRWASWAADHLHAMARAVATHLGDDDPARSSP